MLHSELTLTRVIRGVFLGVVWTLDDTIFTVANVSTAVPELILGLHFAFAFYSGSFINIITPSPA